MVAVFSIGRLQFALEIFESRGCPVRMILTSLFLGGSYVLFKQNIARRRSQSSRFRFQFHG